MKILEFDLSFHDNFKTFKATISMKIEITVWFSSESVSIYQYWEYLYGLKRIRRAWYLHRDWAVTENKIFIEKYT